MNKKDIITGTITLMITLTIIVLTTMIIVNQFSFGVNVMEGLCESAGGEVHRWSCGNVCTLNCKYPNGTQVNLTKELNKIDTAI